MRTHHEPGTPSTLALIRKSQGFAGRVRGLLALFSPAEAMRDMRQGLRGLRKNPGFAAAAILTLALGIGANSTIFSWLNATLLNPIPGMSRPSEGVAVENGRAGPFSYPDFADLQGSARSLSGLTAFGVNFVNLTAEGRPQRAAVMLVSANYFDVLGVKPVIGRGFLPTENQLPDGAPVAVLSYALWQNRFAGNPAVFGQAIHINTKPFTIVGVAPPEFQGSMSGLRFDLWLPLTANARLDDTRGSIASSRAAHWLSVVGRLHAGVTPEQAQAELTADYRQIAAQYPDSHKEIGQITLYPLWRAPSGADAFFSTLMPILMGIAGVVLLLACINIANLLLMRGVSRQKEISIRLSLGASRAQLIRQLLLENLLLAVAGGAIALALTVWTSKSFMSFAPKTNLPIWIAVNIDRRVLLATLAITITTALLFGIVPALRASGTSPAAVIKEESGTVAGGRSKGRLSGALAMAQVALSLVLLVCAGLFARSFRATQTFDPGFNARDVLLESFDLASNGYKQASGIAFDREALERVRSLQGVKAASLTDWVPLGFDSNSDEFTPEGYVMGPHESPGAGVARVSPGYFSTLQIPLISGRDFSPQDGAVVIVNQTLANRYWPNQDALGKRLKVEGEWATIIGVVHTTHYYDFNERPKPFLYLPVYHFYSPDLTLQVRTSGNPSAFAGAVADLLHKMDATLPVFDIAVMSARVGVSSFVQRMASVFVGAFGVLALILAAVGIYGVIAYDAKQRTHEIGIRMALGAQPGDVLRLTLGRAARITLIGGAMGVTIALASARLMSGLLYGVGSSDPATYLGVALLLTAVALLAGYFPARRSSRVDPMVALRHE